jgi:hypothetical protein
MSRGRDTHFRTDDAENDATHAISRII